MSQVLTSIFYLLLIFSHHCSTTYGASIASRHQAAEATSTTTEPIVPGTVSQPPSASSASATGHGDISLNSTANHAMTLNAQNDVIQAGQSLSLGITNALISPLTFVNNKISQAASTLPALMAANGALLGTAIATPIQLGTLAANNVAAGVTGTLVSIPISMVSGGTAHLIGVVETGRELYHGKVSALNQAIQQNLPALIRPAAVIGGANALVGGIALGVASEGVARLGQGVTVVGSSLANAGQGLSSVGDRLIVWGKGGQFIPSETEATTEAAEPETTETAAEVQPTTQANFEESQGTTTEPNSDLVSITTIAPEVSSDVQVEQLTERIVQATTSSPL